ncbi:MAG TPA: selenium-dependent molybdenum cofactor biosynthesis protein YqeB [Symbiobacteriaceae bacterium]|nr:selenium-dependent molybdenum cofactor biosynthesis protein YqeB [Symbiobacteriaceae bacterium]
MSDLVLIKGAGDLATGVAARLYRAGFRILMTELPAPLCVRRTVSFAEAVVTGCHTVEGITAVRADTVPAVRAALAKGWVTVAVDPDARLAMQLSPVAVVDAIMAKRNTGTRITDAPVVVAMGPGFTAGRDCHAVVETMRGHDLGRVLYQGSALPDTGIPGEIGGASTQRVLRAPSAGLFRNWVDITDKVAPGDIVGEVHGADGNIQAVRTTIAGVVRGLVRDGTFVWEKLKIGDVDPRGEVSQCYTISDKARAIGGGVLEALLALRSRAGESVAGHP